MKRRLSTKKIILFIIKVLLVIILIFCLFKIFNWFKDNNKTKNMIRTIEKEVTIDYNNEDSTIIEQQATKSDPYWDYINLPLTNVNFNDLKKINNEVIGWLQVNGTNVNYPVVQAGDNSFYLSHSFDKSKNSAGWIFMDYRNNYKEIDQNNIIYAHGRLDQTMFGSLRNVLKENWLEDQNNYVIT